MKKFYKMFLVVAIFMIATNVSAQRIVEVDGYQPGVSTGSIDDFVDVLYNTIVADSTARMENPNTIYELKRDNIYPQGSRLDNYGYKLHIRGQEGEGLLPEISAGKGADGNYPGQFFRAREDVTFENIQFNGFKPDGSYMNRQIQLRGNNIRAIYRNVTFYADRGGAIAFFGDSMKVYVEDVIAQNIGHHNVVGGNGRLIDLRCAYVDTLVVKNTTITNASDRVLRNMGVEVNYVELDHVTAYNNMGLHGAVQLGFVHTAKVTNCVFGNVISYGHTDSGTKEQTQPVKHFAVISLDTIFDGQSIEIRNNNIFDEQSIIDVWAKYDSVEAPYALSPTAETALGDAASDAYFNEVLTFGNSCGNLADFVDTYYGNNDATEYPENWCIGGAGGLFPDQVDLSYGTEATSYTAADDNYPVGNLNYYPELKAKWENGVVVSNDEIRLVEQVNCYPNPFKNSTTLSYELNEGADVKLEIYNLTGRKVQTVVNEFQLPGCYDVNVTMENLPNGNYFFKLQNGASVSTGKMMYIK